MACNDSCRGSGQATTSPSGRNAQEQRLVTTAVLTEASITSPSRSFVDKKTSSCAEDTCCSPKRGQKKDASQPKPCCSSLSAGSHIGQSIIADASKTTIQDDCCTREPLLEIMDESKNIQSRDCCAENTIASTQLESLPVIDDLATSDAFQSLPSVKKDCCSKTDGNRGCCTSQKNVGTTVSEVEVLPSRPETDNATKSGVGGSHVVLSVSGMTCTGCETKLRRTLATLPYVRHVRTSLILARVEFDIDSHTTTVMDVIKHLARTTEFECEQVLTTGSSLDLVCSGKAAVVANHTWPHGVLEISILDKDTIRVAYDAKVIGARDLVEKGWESAMQLAPIRPDPSLEAGNRHIWHMGLLTLLSACLTIPVLVMAWAPLPDRKITYSSASLALATIVQVCIAGPFYPKALKALVFSGVVEMDLLIVLSTSAAYVFSVVSFGYMMVGDPLSTGEFFETSTLLVTLIMVGRWVASLARQKAAESVSIRSLQTPAARLVGSDGQDREVDARLLQYGDMFRVAPDTQIPTDGTVVGGTSEVDEAMLTGESTPVVKQVGSPVIAGSINGSGLLTIRLTRLPGDNTITTIASMVDEAKLSKPRIQDIADKVASYFVPAVVGLAILTFVIWVAIGVAVRQQPGAEATIEAITYAITVLIVSCPCAIGLAVPMVIVIATGMAARHGVIFKSAASIEIAYQTTDVVLDKTGTLTLGQLQVVEEAEFHQDPSLSKSMLLGLLGNIKHPVSTTVASHLTSKMIEQIVIQDAKVVTGKGVEGAWQGAVLRAGNSRWLDLDEHPLVQSLLSKGLTVTCFTVDGNFAAVYGLRDTIRPGASALISELQRRSISIHILSGDDDGAVQSVASQLSIPSSNVRSRCSPANKRAYIEALQARPLLPQTSNKERKSNVLFVGDGTNDAVALAQATVGVHMSSGTDIAQSAADVVLVNSDLCVILTLLEISRKAMHRVAFNFGWSFFYNLFAVLLAAGAFVNVRIPPEFAGLGELVSVLPVVAAAVLLRWSKV